jgi:hypothetical protein
MPFHTTSSSTGLRYPKEDANVRSALDNDRDRHNSESAISSSSEEISDEEDGEFEREEVEREPIQREEATTGASTTRATPASPDILAKDDVPTKRKRDTTAQHSPPAKRRGPLLMPPETPSSHTDSEEEEDDEIDEEEDDEPENSQAELEERGTFSLTHAARDELLEHIDIMEQEAYETLEMCARQRVILGVKPGPVRDRPVRNK